MNNDFTTKLSILNEILGKKKAALTAVLNICENQEQLYLAPPSEMRREFLMEMGKEKQAQIDAVISCDEVFQSVFDGIRGEFEQTGKQHPEAVRTLQAGIKEVVELDLKIRNQEEKAKAAAKEHFAVAGIGQPPINTKDKNYVLEQYKNQGKIKRGGAK